jgi:hypothetical protein
MKIFNRNHLCIAIATLTLSACGGGGGGTDSTSSNNTNNSTNTATSSIQGVAADGYLLNAKACFDLNDNKKCDTGEPSADTAADGSFTISGVSTADKDKHGVVVEVNTATIDQDTGKAVGKNYTLTAPPGKPSFVSPITTMIHTKMEKDGINETDAEKIVKQDMGFSADSSVDLFKDYVKNAKDTTTDPNGNFAKIHKIAKITATILGDNKDAVETAATNAGQDPTKFAAEIVNLVVQKVLDQLQTIQTVVDKNPSKSDFTSDDLKTDGLTTTVDTSTIKTDLETEKDTRTVSTTTTTPTDIAALLTTGGGITEFRVDKSCTSTSCTKHFIAHNIQFKKSDTGVLTLNQTSTEYNPTTSKFDITPKAFPHKSYIITSTGPQLNDDSTTTFSVSGNTATETLVGGLQKQHQLVKETALDNLDVNHFLEEANSGGVLANTTFSAGAKAFKFATSYPSDIYESPLDNDQGKCWNTAVTYVDSNTNCNVVTIPSTTGATPSVAKTLDDVFSTSSTDKKSIGIRKIQLKLVPDANTKTSGKAYLFKDGSTSTTPDATLTWERKTVNTVDMVLITFSPDMGGDFDGAPKQIFLFEQGGLVRYGSVTPAGSYTLDKGFMFNTTAADDIKAHFTVPSTTTSTTTGTP